MSFCPNCGTQNKDGNRFCKMCGTSLRVPDPVKPAEESAVVEVPETEPEAVPVPVQEKAPATVKSSAVSNYNPLTELVPYDGKEMLFTLEGQAFSVSEEMDAYLHYRKVFQHAAKYMVQHVMRDYDEQVRDLDSYLTKFPIMYVHYRRYLVDAAVKILVNYEIYDIDREEFETELGKDFSKCNEVYETIIEAFNNTIAENQARAARNVSLLPSMIFSGGVLGFAQALAYNAATTSLAESCIRNANVSASQRNEIFRRITREDVYSNLMYDYWAVHYSLTYRMHERGIKVWYPSIETNTKAKSLMSNITNDLVPDDKKASALIQTFVNRPMQKGLIQYIMDYYQRSPEAMAIVDYVGLENSDR